LFEQKEWKHIIVWSLIFMIILIEKINTIRVLRIIVIFSEKQIIVKRHSRDIYMVRQYKDWPYVYYCQSYRHLTYLVFSDKPMEKKTLRKKANRNEIIEKVFDDGAIMIRMNEWVKEKELIKEVIRQNYPNIEEVD